MQAVPEVQFESAVGMAQAEFARWVEKRQRWDLNRYELLNGRIVMTPPAGYPHGEIGSGIQFLLVGFVRPRALGKVLDSSQGFELPSGDTVEPDHTFVSRERWEAAPAPEIGAFLRVVPDLVVEVLSTSTKSRDRGEKKAIYERNGVREYWLVDNHARQLVVFSLVGGKYGEARTFAEADRFVSTVLDGLDVPVGELFV